MTMQDEPIYKVIFLQNGKIYEIYARYISEESLMGFIEVEDLLFSDPTPGTVVVDPTEERLRTEFKGVKRFYIPMHELMRIDEVYQQGTAKIKSVKGKAGNVSPFPHLSGVSRKDDEDSNK